MTTLIDPEVLDFFRARANGSTDGSVLVSAHGVIRILDALKEAQEIIGKMQSARDALPADVLDLINAIKKAQSETLEARARCDALADALKGAVEALGPFAGEAGNYDVERPNTKLINIPITIGLLRNCAAALDKANAALKENVPDYALRKPRQKMIAKSNRTRLLCLKPLFKSAIQSVRSFIREYSLRREFRRPFWEEPKWSVFVRPEYLSSGIGNKGAKVAYGGKHGRNHCMDKNASHAKRTNLGVISRA